MKSQYIIVLILQAVISKVLDIEKKKFCANLACQDFIYERVCGFRSEGEGFRLKLFENECELLKYGCNVDEEKGVLHCNYNNGPSHVPAYGLINKEYCEQTFEADFNKRSDNPIENKRKLNRVLFYKNNETDCNIECIDKILSVTCGIRKDGSGFRIRNFESECDIDKYNCENDVEFTKIDNYYCENDIHKQNGEETVENDKITKTTSNATNLVVVNAGIIGDVDNINDTIDTFFAASHVFDLPVKEVTPFNTRRRRIKIAGPVKVFVPWIVKPDVISNDTYSIPTLSSCYHRCPTKCPDTYAPVCGVPGIVAREPSIMFQNHCFMDVAQCKMFWENKSYTSQSSSYVEASFLFCMGDEMNAVYRFLPAIRTLQHMGRLKKKGKFRARLRNFRYVSDFRSGRPKFMG